MLGIGRFVLCSDIRFHCRVQSKLEPDFEQMNHILLKIVASAALGNVPTGTDAALPEWSGPDSTIVHVQAVLYSSLSASLLAAFVAMLGKQWLNRYASVEHGSIVDRGRDRKRKMDGVVTWRFGLVMECLPLLLQAALLLLGYALSNYLFFVNRAVASVLIGFTTFGLLFYLLIISVATLSYNCPFQTPLSLILQFLIHFDHEHRGYLKQSKKWFSDIFSWIKKGQILKSGSLCSWRRSPADENNFSEHIELHVAGQPPPIFDLGADWGSWDGYVVDSKCITWMFEMPMDVDVTMAIAGFIPEIIFHADTQTIPLEGLYNTVLRCFDHSSGHLILKPGLRDHAYVSAKALVHVGIQRRCIGDASRSTEFKSIMDRHQAMGFRYYKGDSDLESTLGFIDRVFGSFGPMNWQNSSFTLPHHSWVAHILLYRAWDFLRKGRPVPGYIREFIHLSLQFGPTLPVPIKADCLFLIGLVLEIRLHPQDLLVIDKR